MGAITGRRGTAARSPRLPHTAAYVVYAAGLMLLTSVESWLPFSPFYQAFHDGPLGAGLTSGYGWLLAGSVALTAIALPALTAATSRPPTEGEHTDRAESTRSIKVFRPCRGCRGPAKVGPEVAYMTATPRIDRYVFDFAEGSKEQKDLLGGKGANLAEMTRLGLPVPPGFTIGTTACRTYLRTGDSTRRAQRRDRRAPGAAGARDGPTAR